MSSKYILNIVRNYTLKTYWKGVDSIKKMERPHCHLRLDADVVVNHKVLAHEAK